MTASLNARDGGNATASTSILNTAPCVKAMVFDGATTDDPGEFDSATSGVTTLFTVTGTVRVSLVAICTTLLAGASATVEVGVTGGTATLLAQTTGTDIDTGEIWHDATPDAFVELSSVILEKVVANGLDIIQTVATADVTSGAITYYCFWQPISPGASVIAA